VIWELLERNAVVFSSLDHDSEVIPVSSGHSAIGDVAAKTEAPTSTNDIVRSSCKLQIAAGGRIRLLG